MIRIILPFQVNIICAWAIGKIKYHVIAYSARELEQKHHCKTPVARNVERVRPPVEVLAEGAVERDGPGSARPRATSEGSRRRVRAQSAPCQRGELRGARQQRDGAVIRNTLVEERVGRALARGGGHAAHG